VTPKFTALPDERLGQLIRRRRRELGLTPLELAATGGFDRQSVYAWEKGQRITREYDALARALGVTGTDVRAACRATAQHLVNEGLRQRRSDSDGGMSSRTAKQAYTNRWGSLRSWDMPEGFSVVKFPHKPCVFPEAQTAEFVAFWQEFLKLPEGAYGKARAICRSCKYPVVYTYDTWHHYPVGPFGYGSRGCRSASVNRLDTWDEALSGTTNASPLIETIRTTGGYQAGIDSDGRLLILAGRMDR
jgi:transcriptional regulator with XRE-family HTH domain